MKAQYIRMSRELVDEAERADCMQRALADAQREAARLQKRRRLAAAPEQMWAQLQRANADAEAKSAALRKLENRLASSAEGTSLLSRAHAAALQQSNASLRAQHVADSTRIGEMDAIVRELNAKVALLQSAVHVRATELLRASPTHTAAAAAAVTHDDSDDAVHSAPSRVYPIPCPAPPAQRRDQSRAHSRKSRLFPPRIGRGGRLLVFVRLALALAIGAAPRVRIAVALDSRHCRQRARAILAARLVPLTLAADHLPAIVGRGGRARARGGPESVESDSTRTQSRDHGL